MPNISAPSSPPAESLSGTRTSHRWSEVPGSFDAVNARAIYPSGNEYGIPDLPAATVIPARLTAYSDRRACENAQPGDCLHTFLDDYRFETCWSKPQRALSRVARVGLALTPDFSLWRDMPAAMQVWQVYRSRWCGMWWLSHGVSVIPTVSWSTPASYRYCFAGIAPGSVVAVSSVGVIRDRRALPLFAGGITELLGRVSPAAIICYGAWPRDAIREPRIVDRVTEYPTRWER